jgi:c-di-GMP-binding flagellar brake protein YcgR
VTALAIARAQQEFDERFREVTGKTYILTLLQSLVRRRLLVSIFLPGSDVQYTSTVLKVDSQDNSLILDELFPLSGHKLLEKVRQLRLFAHLGGAAMGFTTRLRAVESEEGLYYYRLEFPDSVNYLQRRDDHRVVVSLLKIHAELYDHQGKVHKGILQDISTGGISLKLAEADAFHRNDVFRCTLHLPGEEPFHCKIDISSKRAAVDQVVVGGSFAGLDKRGEHALWRVVAELERRLLRLRWEPAAAPPEKAK